MHISGHDAFVTRKTADLNVLADGLDLLVQGLLHGLAVLHGTGQQGFHVGGVLLGHRLGGTLHEGLEGIVFGHEVGLGVDLDDHAHLGGLVDIGHDGALGGDAAGLFGDLGQALFAENINRFVHIALGFHQGLFAVHHAASGLFAERLYVFRSKCCHTIFPPYTSLLIGLPEKCPRLSASIFIPI